MTSPEPSAAELFAETATEKVCDVVLAGGSGVRGYLAEVIAFAGKPQPSNALEVFARYVGRFALAARAEFHVREQGLARDWSSDIGTIEDVIDAAGTYLVRGDSEAMSRLPELLATLPHVPSEIDTQRPMALVIVDTCVRQLSSPAAPKTMKSAGPVPRPGIPGSVPAPRAAQNR